MEGGREEEEEAEGKVDLVRVRISDGLVHGCHYPGWEEEARGSNERPLEFLEELRTEGREDSPSQQGIGLRSLGRTSM